MPRPRPRTSALRTPLDFVLGTLGSVRVLRVLATTSVPLSQSELARRADVTPSALPGVLVNLENAGMIEYEGRGRTRQVRLHQRHPLIFAVGQLFRDEQGRWQRMQDELRRIAQLNTPDLISAWIGGPVAVRQDAFTDPIVLGILTEAPLDIALQEGARTQANVVQSKEHVIIALRFYQRPDLLRFTPAQLDALRSAIVLYGPAPIDLISTATAQHLTSQLSERDDYGKRARNPKAIADRIAHQLLKEPEILASAKTYIDRRLPLAGQVERLALIEWQGLLESLTPRQIAALLREESERAEVLRQNMPFHGALTSDERDKALASVASVRRNRP